MLPPPSHVEAQIKVCHNTRIGTSVCIIRCHIGYIAQPVLYPSAGFAGRTERVAEGNGCTIYRIAVCPLPFGILSMRHQRGKQ
jgi:hypothetical protein